MPNVKTKVKVKRPNPKTDINVKIDTPKIDTKGMTKRQKYRVAKKQLEVQTLKVNAKPGIIKAAGNAVNNALTPLSTKIVVNGINEGQAVKRNSAVNDALSSWNSMLSGDPENETKKPQNSVISNLE